MPATAKALGDGQLAETPTLVVEPAEGSRTTLVDGSGNFAGLISGRLPDLDPASSRDGAIPSVQALSYVIDRTANTLKVVWASVPDATSYELRAGRDVLAVTTQLSAAIPLDGLAPGDLVDVVAIGPVDGVPRHDTLATMSLVLGDYEVSWQNSLKLSGANGALVAAAPSKTTFTFQTFIPDNFVRAPLLCGGSWFPNRHYFKGDNRSFSFTSRRYRTKMVTELNWGGTDGTRRYVGQTKRYRRSDNGTYSRVDARTAPASGMSWEGPTNYGSTHKRFVANHDVGNPYCLGGVGEIDYTVVVTVERRAGFNGFIAFGAHDRAPNYAFYYQDSSTGAGWHRFRAWNRGSFSCLSACTQTSFSVVK